MKLDPKLVLEGGYTFESGVACAQQLLERPPAARPTAVFAGNDEMAVGVYQAARRAGFGVPEDLSIVGFDDTPMASRIWPPLTTVRLPIREMGKAAAALLIARAARARRARRVPAGDHRAPVDRAVAAQVAPGSIERTVFTKTYQATHPDMMDVGAQRAAARSLSRRRVCSRPTGSRSTIRTTSAS